MLAPSIKGPVLSKVCAPKPYLLPKNGLDLTEQKMVANWFDKKHPHPKCPHKHQIATSATQFLAVQCD